MPEDWDGYKIDKIEEKASDPNDGEERAPQDPVFVLPSLSRPAPPPERPPRSKMQLELEQRAQERQRREQAERRRARSALNTQVNYIGH